jgi:type I restriction enzyme S subunit
MPSLNQAILARVVVPYAPLPEQRAIAAALSDADALLDGLTRLIAKKRDLKQAAMQQLLTGQTRLPGFSGEWEVKSCGEIGEIRSGGTPSTNQPDFWNGGLPWCTPTDITGLSGRKYLTETARTISPGGLIASAADLIPSRSLIMTTRATIGECAINLVPMTTNQGFKNVVPYAGTDVEFLYYLMTLRKAGLISLCGGSTFLEIGKKQLSAYELRLPKDKTEQTAIAAVLSDMDTELEALEARREKTRALKQAMMQELLTGRTRLVASASSASVTDPKKARRTANVHFQRAVLAAEIVDRLYEEPTFGHVKFEKLMFLVEHICKVDTGSTYHRDAAGPYDNRAIRSIDKQLKEQQWFDVRKVEKRYRYLPLAKRGGHQQYFDRYFGSSRPVLDQILDTFRAMETEKCEIVATLFSAWQDLLKTGAVVSDDLIVDEVRNRWHDAKKRIPDVRWRKALEWMRTTGFVPTSA